MHSMFKKSKITRLTRNSVVLSFVLMTAACSSDPSENFFQSVMRFPSRTIDKSGDFWDKHVKGVPPNWQKNLQLGSPRKPVLNPGGTSEGLSAEEYWQQRRLSRPVSQFPELSKRQMTTSPSNISSPPVFEASGNSYVPQMMQDSPAPYMPKEPAQYVPPPSFAPVDTGVKYTPLLPLPSSLGSDDMGMGAGYETHPVSPVVQKSLPPYAPSFEDESLNDGYVPDARSSVRAAEPIPPWEKNRDYLGTSSSSEQPSKAPSGSQKKASPFKSSYSEQLGSDSDDTGGAINPYDEGNFEKGFKPPSYDQVDKMGEDAFAPIEHKYERVFEPMAAEYYVDGVETVDNLDAVSEDEENIGFEPLDVKKKH